MIRTKRYLYTVLSIIGLVCAACGKDAADNSGSGPALFEQVQEGPTSIPAGTRAYVTDALIFTGTGSWSAEVTSLKSILSGNGATYETATSAELNAMSLDELEQFGTIIWPGGYGNQMSDSLATSTITKVRTAVRERGVNYVGFCAGSFVAVSPTPADGARPEYGLSIVNGSRLKYYYLEQEFVDKGKASQDWTMTNYSFADGTERAVLWYGGPVTPDVSGHVVARYPNGDAAITQLWSGNGLVLLSAGHPTASNAIYSSFGLTDPDGLDHDIAWKLIRAAVTQRPLQSS